MKPINFDQVFKFFFILQYCVFKAVGLSPWTLEVSKIWNRNFKIVIRSSDIGSGFNVLLILALAIHYLYFCFVSDENRVEIMNRRTSKVVISIVVFLETLSTCGILIFFAYAQKSVIRIIDRLVSVNKKIKTESKPGFKNLLGFFIFFINLLVAAVELLIRLPYSSVVGTVLNVSFSNMFYSCIILQFTLLAAILGRQLELLNSSIKRVGEATPGFRDQNVCREIGNIKKAYVELVEISGEINDFYGPSVLISLLYYSCEVITSLHYITMAPLLDEIGSFLLYITQAIVTPRVVILFLVLTFTVSKTTDQSKKTGQIIRVLSNRQTINLEAKEQLIKFSKDLQHFKIEFSACGALPLDRNLLGIASGTIVTFLVLIVQEVDLNRSPVFPGDSN